jgi:hypothetical protein
MPAVTMNIMDTGIMAIIRIIMGVTITGGIPTTMDTGLMALMLVAMHGRLFLAVKFLRLLTMNMDTPIKLVERYVTTIMDRAMLSKAAAIKLDDSTCLIIVQDFIMRGL